MKRIARATRGGLVLTLAAAGLFLLAFPPVYAALPIEQMRETVERYAAEQLSTSTRAFFIGPTVLEVHSNLTPEGKPLIFGLAPNHTTLQVFIDDILADTVPVNETDGEVAVFAYQPSWLLAQATHTVYVRAFNRRGDVSQPSNRLYFSVSDAVVPQISATRIERAEIPALDFSGAGVVASAAADVLADKKPNSGEFVLLVVLCALLAVWAWREWRG